MVVNINPSIEDFDETQQGKGIVVCVVSTGTISG